ncbi:hypothetical protein [Rhodoferax sp. GW822-FHT02A01]|uniref:hypothetical protein n=1 Tax=Rhodoferax sp. GW822-FHT02A01 TaxID=3141537 RepID=UPI00315DF6B2
MAQKKVAAHGDAGILASVDHALGGRKVNRQRLFAQHMQATSGRMYNGRFVLFIGGGDVDGLHPEVL